MNNSFHKNKCVFIHLFIFAKQFICFILFHFLISIVHTIGFNPFGPLANDLLFHARYLGFPWLQGRSAFCSLNSTH